MGAGNKQVPPLLTRPAVAPCAPRGPVMSGGATRDDLTTSAVITASRQEELGALKPRALKQRALELGVDPERLDEADDADILDLGLKKVEVKRLRRYLEKALRDGEAKVV